jgi:hypothetical protein
VKRISKEGEKMVRRNVKNVEEGEKNVRRKCEEGEKNERRR